MSSGTSDAEREPFIRLGLTVEQADELLGQAEAAGRALAAAESRFEERIARVLCSHIDEIEWDALPEARKTVFREAGNAVIEVIDDMEEDANAVQ